MLSHIPNGFNRENTQNIKESENNSIKEAAKKSMEKMVLAKKGEAAYNREMDLDDDGTITYGEFEEYCDEKSIPEANRADMMEAMLKARLIKGSNEEETEEIEEDDKEETEEDKENTIYSKKDDNQNASINSDEKTTDYDEYINYCEQNQKETPSKVNSRGSLAVRNALKAYSFKHFDTQPPRIMIDGEA